MKSTKIRIFNDFKDLPFKNGTAHTQISIFEHLRGPSTRWPLLDVGRDNIPKRHRCHEVVAFVRGRDTWCLCLGCHTRTAVLPRPVHVVRRCVEEFSRYVRSACIPHAYHVQTTCRPRAYHVHTTCISRAYRIHTTCTPRAYHMHTTWKARVYHV